MSYLIAFIWGFSEATFFFFIPDIYLTRVAIFNLKKAIIACSIAALGACLGGGLLYLWGATYPNQAFYFLTWIPAIFPKLIAEVVTSIHQYPLSALMLGPVKGIPYKIYAVALGAIKINFPIFIIVSFIARLARFLLLTILGGIVASFLKLYLKLKTILYIHLFFWTVIYIIYFCNMVYYYY